MYFWCKNGRKKCPFWFKWRYIYNIWLIDWLIDWFLSWYHETWIDFGLSIDIATVKKKEKMFVLNEVDIQCESMHSQYPAENNGNRCQRHPQRKRPIPGVFLHFLNPRQPDDVIRANNEEDCCTDPTGKKSRSTDRKNSLKWNESHFLAVDRKAPVYRTERTVSNEMKAIF